MLAWLAHAASAAITTAPHRIASAPRCAAVQSKLELQSDFGRGNEHLSWLVEDEDVVVYQVGTWLVDNVEVGDGSPARLRFAYVDNVQINFTQHSEHGVIRGTALLLCTDGVQLLFNADDEIQFGPEQLVARVSGSLTWTDDSTLVLPESLPAQIIGMAEEVTLAPAAPESSS